MAGIKIEFIDYYLPESILCNDEIAPLMNGWTAEKIYNKIGIKKRHICSNNETALDLAEKACLKIKGKVDFNEVESLIICTQSPDYLLPTGACILQNRLGLKTSTMCFDFNLGCSGYVYGIAIARGLILSKTVKNCLLVTTDTYSKYISESDGSNRSLFGDAASATFFTSSGVNTILAPQLGTDGSGSNNLMVRGGALFNLNNNPIKPILEMNGPAIFEFTNFAVPSLISTTLSKNDMTIDEIDYFVFHQANKFMLEHLKKKIGIPDQKFLIDFEEYGNTVSSTIPILIANKQKNDLNFFKNKTVMLVGFGVGYSWGAIILKM
jgi:3-oxoacyl-[acyl-carrier-protein] synthase-3